KRVKETIKLEGMLCVFERLNLAGKNGIFNVRCHTAVVPLFFVGEGTCRKREGAGRLSLRNTLLLIVKDCY
ncbi:hypothetical protein GE21DRAFT_1215939, partial [Neurospora crassa]